MAWEWIVNNSGRANFNSACHGRPALLFMPGHFLEHYIFSQPLGGSDLATKLCPTLATSWTVAHQAPLSMRFSRQEYWSGFPFPSPSTTGALAEKEMGKNL